MDFGDTSKGVVDPSDLSTRFNGAEIREGFDGYAQSYKDIMSLRVLKAPNITVCDAQLMGSGPSKHHAYRVKGTDHFGDVEVFRRYKEFDRIRKILMERFPGLFVPPLPEKKKINNTKKEFV